jgi:DNA modification methylase
MTHRIERIGDAELHLADCRDVLPTLSGVDAVVTDPPYGLGDRLRGGNGEWSAHFSSAPAWDAATVPDGFVESLRGFATSSIIWGGNYYELPPARGWLLWDKMQEHSSGHAELAWTNLDIPVRTFRMCRAEAYGKGKHHPTEKPADLMGWCLGFIPKAATILDPFMGSGTTGVACIQLGRKFIGIEIEPKYFDIACRRIEEASKQGDLIRDVLPKPEQKGLDL